MYRVELKTADPDPGLLTGDDAGDASDAGEGVERLRRAHPPRELLPEDIQYGVNVRTTNTLGRTKPNGIDTESDSAWRCVSRAAPRFVPHPRTDEVIELEGKEVLERSDHPRALELVHCADDKVGYKGRAIVMRAL